MSGKVTRQAPLHALLMDLHAAIAVAAQGSGGTQQTQTGAGIVKLRTALLALLEGCVSIKQGGLARLQAAAASDLVARPVLDPRARIALPQ